MFGAPSCELWIDPITGMGIFYPVRFGDVPIWIPNNPVLSGQLVAIQILVLNQAGTGLRSATNAGVMRL
jgi:hypothetical protein